MNTILVESILISKATKKNKKVKWGIRLGIGGLFFIGLIFWSFLLAIMFLFIYALAVLPGRGSSPGLILFGGFGGGFGGGGFGGFGGGFSGGGGAGGGW